MKLWFQGGGWDKKRYHYAAEQMMLTLFPGERPEYPEAPPEQRHNTVIFTLERGESVAMVHTLLFWEGRPYRGAFSFPDRALEAEPVEVYHTIQRAVKQSFYQAGTALVGRDLPWGSLTGVRPTKLPTRAMWNGATPAQAEQELQNIYHVSPLRCALAVECAEASVQVRRSLAHDEVSIYVGIPFCPSRCVYCSFISAAVDKCLSLMEPFTQALEKEIACTGDVLRDTDTFVRSVYIGGGTPTTLSTAQMERLLTALTRELPLSRCSEFTVEAGRPDTITPEKLSLLVDFGVGRISVNPQSMDDAVLHRMGRPHTAQDIRRAFEEVRTAGTFTVNMDLIAGLPGDTPDGFQRSLAEVLALSPENITVHTLALKKGAKLMETSAFLPSDIQVEAMLNTAWSTLRKAGYVPYYLYRQKYMFGSFENVGWTRPGFQSFYNIIMIEELQTVLALGGGGVSKLVEGDTGRLQRRANPKYPHEYLRDREKICMEKENLAKFLRDGKI